MEGARDWMQSHPAWTCALVHTVAQACMVALLAVRPGPLRETLRQLSRAWDANYYLGIARSGYPDAHSGTPAEYAFAPLFPLLVRVTGASEWSPLAVAVAAGIVASACVGAAMGLRAGLWWALFPVWLVFSATGYSEALFVLLAAAALLAWQKGHPALAGLAAAGACLTRYVGALAFVAVAGAALFSWWRGRHAQGAKPWRQVALLLGPVAAVGVGVMAWHTHALGSPWGYLDAQRHWDARLQTPYHQWQWLLHGWYTHQPSVLSRSEPYEWLLRTLAFQALAVAGLWVLWRRAAWVPFAFAAPLVLVVAATTGMPAVSVPRLLLTAFPAIAAVGMLVPARVTLALSPAAVLLASWVAAAHLRSFWA